MTDMKTAVEKTLATSSFATPDCFDSKFLNFSFDPNTILDYEQDQQKGLMQMYVCLFVCLFFLSFISFILLYFYFTSNFQNYFVFSLCM